MVGKRKRETAVVSRSTKTKEASPPPANDAQDIFRKYFEAQFEPIEQDAPSKRGAEELDSGDEDHLEDDDDISEPDSDWDGLDEESDEDNVVEIVEHKDASLGANDLMDKKARKAFMSAKPPSSVDEKKKPTKTSKKDDSDDDANDAMNLKHDLDLQRLLRESHLLDSASELAPTGKNRLKALDLRMQDLGAKESLYKQKNMPDAFRQGIKAKAISRDEKRRREAKENGIILEKPSKVAKTDNKRRERGIGGSSIGKFSGGTLNLSKQDLHSMQSSRGRGGRGGRGGRSGRGGRGGRGGQAKRGRF